MFTSKKSSCLSISTLSFSKKLVLATSVGIASGLFVGCSETSKDKLGEAQFCLDASTPATVNQCLSKIAGDESAQAYALRCSANFISQGLGSAQTLSDALNNISGTSGGGNSALFSVLSFKAATTDESRTLAATAQSNCDKSGNAGMKLIASMATTATTLANLIPGLDPTVAPDEAAIKSVLNTLQANLTMGTDEQKAQALSDVRAITDALVSTYNSSCQSGGSSDTEICKQLIPAFQSLPPGASNDDIATALIIELNKTPTP